MSDRIYKITRPYIYEGRVACLTDFSIAAAIIIAMLVFLKFDYPLGYYFGIPLVLLFFTIDAAVFGMPLWIKSRKDRKEQTVITETCTLEGMLFDRSHSNKLTGDPESILTNMYYPKEWNMRRCFLIMRKTDGTVIKPRCILAFEHYQGDFIDNVRGIQAKASEPILLQVRYLKYSKAIIDVRVLNMPRDIKKRTAEYIYKGFSELTRWTVKTY